MREMVKYHEQASCFAEIFIVVPEFWQFLVHAKDN